MPPRKITDVRSRILAAIVSTDNSSPFVSPTQLADALAQLVEEILEATGKRQEREWVTKEVLKRTHNISDYACKQILAEYNIPFRTTEKGKIRYSSSQFKKALAHACI